MMEKAAIRAAAEGILRNRFMHEDFRDGQLEAVKAVVDMDVPNVTVLSMMGTGHGKVRHISILLIMALRDAAYSRNVASFIGLILTPFSLCLLASGSGSRHKQTVIVGVAATLLHMHERSLTVFVTPLSGIGRQHVRTFQEAGIECRGLWGSTTEMERLSLNEAVASRTLVILVASPEAIVHNPTLVSKIKAEQLGLVAFDQAHLFKSWSRWRPDLSLAASRLDFGRRLVLSVTVPIGKTSVVQVAL